MEDMAASLRSILIVVAGDCYFGLETPLLDYTASMLIFFCFFHVRIYTILLNVMNLFQIPNCVSLLDFYVFFWEVFYWLLFELHFIFKTWYITWILGF